MFPSNASTRKKKIIKEITTLGSSTWKVPSGVFEIDVTLVGGQGGSGYDYTTSGTLINNSGGAYVLFYNQAGSGGTTSITVGSIVLNAFGGEPGGFFGVCTPATDVTGSVSGGNGSVSSDYERFLPGSRTAGEYGRTVSRTLPVTPGLNISLFVGGGGVAANWDPTSFPGEFYGTPGSQGKIIITYEV